MLNRILCSLSIVVLLVSALRFTHSANAAPTEGDRRERFEALVEEFDEAERKGGAKFSAADYNFKRFLALAKEKPDDDVAFEILEWIVENQDPEEPTKQLDEALDLIEKHHLRSGDLKELIHSLSSLNPKKAASLLAMIAEKAGKRDTRGMACFLLASSRYERLQGNDAKALAAIATILERVKKDYADLRIEGDQRPLGDLAEALLFQVKYLQPGKVIPDIAGADVGGKKMKLSDFRGKVVMLVFWGSWCGPCMAEVPHERKLMETYSGRPFTVVGVNSGDPQDRAASVIKSQKMTWPSFIDGEQGPIVSRWSINSFPTVFLIDAKGIIKSKDLLSEDEVDQLIEQTVKDAEQK